MKGVQRRSARDLQNAGELGRSREFGHEARMWRLQLSADADEPRTRALPRRQQQVLDCLLQGDGQKRIAGRLGLSSATVHQYVSALYRHFRVSSRAQLLARWIRLGRPPALPDDLSRRLRETLLLLLNGNSERQIAEAMGLSRATVNQYVSALYHRFGATTRSELLARWIVNHPPSCQSSS